MGAFAEDDDFFAEVAGFVPLSEGFFAASAAIDVGGVADRREGVGFQHQVAPPPGGPSGQAVLRGLESLLELPHLAEDLAQRGTITQR